MTDIVKKNGGTQHWTEWNALRAMRDMLRFDPFRELAPMLAPQPALDEWMPSFDVTETADAYLFKADVPGVKKDDLEITTTGNRVEIAGKRETETETKNGKIFTYERQYGSFARTFTLPDGADMEHAKSELKDGVLTLVIPKLAATQAKKIPISAGASKS